MYFDESCAPLRPPSHPGIPYQPIVGWFASGSLSRRTFLLSPAHRHLSGSWTGTLPGVLSVIHGPLWGWMPRQVFSWGELSPEHRREALDFVAYLLEKRARPLRQIRAGGV